MSATLPLCLVPLQWTLLWQIHATVALFFIPGSTHPCHGSFLAFAGLPHTNEHLCDHVVITITLTSDLLSPRPGWNRRWCYHRQAPKPLCESHRNLGTSPHGAIRHKLTSYSRIHKSAFWGRKSLESTSFCPLTHPCSQHFALSGVLYRPSVGQFADFLAWCYCKSYICAWLHSGFSSNFYQFKMYKTIDI